MKTSIFKERAQALAEAMGVWKYGRTAHDRGEAKIRAMALAKELSPIYYGSEGEIHNAYDQIAVTYSITRPLMMVRRAGV